MTSNQVNGPRSWKLRWPWAVSSPVAQKAHKDKWFHCRSHAIAWKQPSMHRNFSCGQLCASAIFVFISRPFQKWFVYLDFTLSHRKSVLLPGQTVRNGESDDKYIFFDILFSFPTKSLFFLCRELFHLICYLRLIKILILFLNFSWKCVSKTISWPKRYWI